jgi:hypothetical protein
MKRRTFISGIAFGLLAAPLAAEARTQLILSIAGANFTNRFSEALGTELEAWRRPTMVDTIQRVEYFYAQVPNKAGEGSRFLTALHEAGINLLAFSGFPEGRGSQLDFVPADPVAFKQFARTAKRKLTGPKRAFLVSGEERVGAVAELHRKLAEAKINVTAIDAVCAGAGRYGAILWVAPRDVSKAAKLLGAA